MDEDTAAVVLVRPAVTHSEGLAQIATALAAAQAELKNAPRDEKGNYGNYADLASVLEVSRPVLSRHGLSVAQFPSADGKRVTVTTLLLHKSGEWLRGELSVDARDAGPQSVGSAVTYCRRYAYMAAIGIAPEDDDAEAAQPARQQAAPARPAPPAEPPARKSEITTPEVDALAAVLEERGYTLAAQLRAQFGLDNARQLTREQYDTFLAAVREWPRRKKPAPEPAGTA